jgi:CO dehydrogenase nickel-insertion accessory protein CooC1
MKQVFLIGNRINSPIQKKIITEFATQNGIKILDFIPFDQTVVEADMHGKTPLENKESTAIKAIDNLRIKLSEIKK